MASGFLNKYLSKKNLIIIFFILFALAVRLQLLFTIRLGDLNNFYSDDAIYMDMARSIFSGNIMRAIHPVWMPFYPLVSALFYYFTNNWASAGIGVSLIFGVLLVIPVFKIMEIVNIKRSYYIGLVILTTTSLLVTSSIRPLTESFFTFITWSTIYCFLKGWKDKKNIFFFASSILAGIGALTRSEGIFTFVVLAIILATVIAGFFIKSNRKISPGVVSVSKFLLVFVFGLLSIYFSFQMVLFKKYNVNLSSAKAVAFFRMTSPFNFNSSKTSTWAQDIYGLDTFNPKSEFLQNGKSFFSTHVSTILNDWKIRINQSIRFILVTFSGIGTVMIILGCLYALNVKHRLGLIVFFITLFNLIFEMLFATQFQERYMIWVIPGLIILINLGIELVINLVNRKSRLLSVVLVTNLFLILIINNRNYLVFDNLVKNYNSWRHSNISENGGCQDILINKTVMLRHEGYVFNSRSNIVYIPNVQKLDELINYAKVWNVDFLAVGPGEVPDNINFLFLKPDNYNNLKLKCIDKGRYAYIYEIQK